MKSISIVSGALLVAVNCCLLARSRADEHAIFIDLEPYENRKLDDNQGRGFDGNALAGLPRGEQTLGGFKFTIGPGLIQLGSKTLTTLPASMDGIKVKRRFSKLNILHATCFGGGPNEEGSDWRIDAGTEIGHYLVHYEDQSTERIAIVYGQDVCDWFYEDGEKEPARAKVVWTGDNEFATSVGCHLRLYATTWTNPKPRERVMRIDFVGRKNETHGAPVCLAMTAIQETSDNAPSEAQAKARQEALERAQRKRTEEGLQRAFRPQNGVERHPPDWQPFTFNGHVYYVIPLR
jgi:hypothetical protein